MGKPILACLLLLSALPARAEKLAPPQPPLKPGEAAIIDTLPLGAGFVPVIDITLARRVLVHGKDAQRFYAARYLGEHGTWDDLPYLIDTLSDDSLYPAGVTFSYAGMAQIAYWANVSLIAITHLDMGYRWDDPPERRAEAIERWKQKWTGYLASKSRPAPGNSDLIECDSDGKPIRAPGLPVGMTFSNPYTRQAWTVQPDHSVTEQPTTLPKP